MKVYQVGPSELNLEEFNEFNEYDWIVYKYEGTKDKGDGFMVSYKNNELNLYNLGHCSCYGPLDGDHPFDTISVEKFREGSIIDTMPDEIHDKVVELLEVV